MQLFISFVKHVVTCVKCRGHMADCSCHLDSDHEKGE